jgi:hypothetical protein
MLNIREQVRGEQKTSVHLRLPKSVREKARALAEAQSTDDIRVREAAIYRSIIENFFVSDDYKMLSKSATSCDHQVGA